MSKYKLVIMLKDPHLNRVKTRLGRDIGMMKATHWFRVNVLNTLQNIYDPRWEIILHVDTHSHRINSPCWPQKFQQTRQCKGSLGRKLDHAFYTHRHSTTCIIGGDIPFITKENIYNAFKLVQKTGAVIGPSDDGGFWLVGLKRGYQHYASFNQNIRWSSAFALQDTIKCNSCLNWSFAERLNDVDTAEDYIQWRNASKG